MPFQITTVEAEGVLQKHVQSGHSSFADTPECTEMNHNRVCINGFALVLSKAVSGPPMWLELDAVSHSELTCKA